MINTKTVDTINPAAARRSVFARPPFLSSSTPVIVALALALALAVVVPAPVLARDLIFLGVTDVRGASAQPELEGELRAELAADGRFRLVGGVETERIVREIERRGHTRAEAFIPPNVGLDDSAVIMRGVVKELSIVTKRRSWLLWGKIDAKMRLEVSFSELSGRSSHVGAFSAEASKRKEFLLFHDPKKTVHVSATDREELLGQMREKLVKDAVGLTETFFNALSSGGLPPKASAGGADTAAAADTSAEFSTVDGKDMAPIDSAGAASGGK